MLLTFNVDDVNISKLVDELRDAYNKHMHDPICNLCYERGNQHESAEECEIAKVIEA